MIESAQSPYEGEMLMVSGESVSDRDGTEVLDRWSARKVQPVVLLYVGAVFAAFIVLAHFVFHSDEAVKALVFAAIGGIAVTTPGVLEKVEYLLTESGIEKRKVDPKKPGEFKDVFRWDQLSHIVPMKHGFKYYTVMDEMNSLGRFWKTHLSDNFSGEIHVEKRDLDRVLRLVERQRIATPTAD